MSSGHWMFPAGDAVGSESAATWPAGLDMEAMPSLDEDDDAGATDAVLRFGEDDRATAFDGAALAVAA
jgi:hypothetical protein